MTLADKLTDEMRKEGLEPTPGQLHTCNMLEIDDKADEKPMIEFRCIKCRKMLGEIYGQARIKCPRCGKMNETKEAPDAHETANHTGTAS